MTKLSLALLFIFIAGCGKAPSMNEPALGKHAQPLVGKTDEEILNLKYNNRINLDCLIRVKAGSSIDLNTSPTDSFSWDIPGELSLMRVLNFKQGNLDTVVVVKMEENIKFIDNQTVTDEKQHEYFMEHSPVLTIAYRRDSKTILSNGSVHEKFRFKNVKLFENVETRIFTMTSEDNDGNELTEDFRCTLKTQANPAYKYQWKIIR